MCDCVWRRSCVCLCGVPVVGGVCVFVLVVSLCVCLCFGGIVVECVFLCICLCVCLHVWLFRYGVLLLCV